MKKVKKKKTRKKYNLNYFKKDTKRVIKVTVTKGNEEPKKPTIFNTHSRVAFFGSCYTCGAPGHSSRFCPLKRCPLCLNRCAGTCADLTKSSRKYGV